MKELCTLCMTLFACGLLNAAIYDETLNQAGGSVSLTDGNSVSFLAYPADVVLFSDDAGTDFNPQSAANIELVLEGYWTGIDLTFVGEEELIDGTASYSTDVDANVYAIHYDNRELIFAYATMQSGFSIEGLSHDFSNMRAYSCIECVGITTTQVPVPAAAGLFGMGLIGLSGIARKRRSS